MDRLVRFLFGLTQQPRAFSSPKEIDLCCPRRGELDTCVGKLVPPCHHRTAVWCRSSWPGTGSNQLGPPPTGAHSLQLWKVLEGPLDFGEPTFHLAVNVEEFALQPHPPLWLPHPLWLLQILPLPCPPGAHSPPSPAPTNPPDPAEKPRNDSSPPFFLSEKSFYHRWHHHDLWPHVSSVLCSISPQSLGSGWGERRPHITCYHITCYILLIRPASQTSAVVNAPPTVILAATFL